MTHRRSRSSRSPRPAEAGRIPERARDTVEMDLGRHDRAAATVRYRERKRIADGGELEAWLDAEREGGTDF